MMKVLLESADEECTTIRVPNDALEGHGFGKEANLTFEGNKIVISPLNDNPREGWDEAFKLMAENGDDELIMPDAVISEWDETEWT